MTDTILPNEGQGSRAVENGYFKKGCNPFAQTGRSRLQNKRVLLNQQIIKQMRMRAGAENLLRATSNNKVREMVMLELSYVNSNLQLLMEDLESLNSSVEVYQNAQESPSTPLIPLGLKETKEVDFLVPFKDFIREHYGEDATNFEDQISDLMDLRQACRTPSRSESGAELFSIYFSHLSLLEPRFFSHSSQIGIFFTWYDSFTGVPVCQHNISLEKASVLFNMGALYTQIGARCARHTCAGLDSAVDAFQKAAGVLQHLKETFIHTPSYDMSPAMLSMLVRMVLAQAQECLFEKAALPGVHNEFFCLCRMAQEAAKVSDSYDQVHQSMTQTPIRDNVPVFWSTMVQVKTHHFRSLAHYFVATALIDHTLTSVSDADQQVKTLSELYQAVPEGRSPLAVLTDRKERLCLGKAHLRRSVVGHEEALRIYGLCRQLGKQSTMGHVLTASHQRSISKFSENEFEEDDFIDYLEAPDIVSKTDHKATMELPAYMKVKVTDFFHKLGPLSVFSAKQQWTPPRVVRLRAGDPDPGFILKGDGPVQVQSLDPLCPAATAGLKEGDYIVAVGDVDCKWMGASEVTGLLPDSSEEDVVIRVVTMMENSLPMPSKSATYSSGIHKTYSMICLDMDDDVMNAKSKKVTKKMSFLGWGQRSKPIGSRAEMPPWARQCPAFPSSYDV